MNPTHGSAASSNPELWQERCTFWAREPDQESRRRRRERETKPLILTGHGLSLRVEKGSLFIRDGNTHYPAERHEWPFFKGTLDIPPAIIVIDGSGEITMDAIDWLAEQGVYLIRLRWDGQFVSVVSARGQAADIQQVRWQESTRLNPRTRLAFGLDLIQQKARNTVVTMREYVPTSPVWDKAFRNIEARTRALEKKPPRTIEELLGAEGSIARDYFRAWSGISIQWRAAKRYPIPDDWRKYRSRSSLRAGPLRNYRATHPVNAMLNYAYGVLTARTQVKLIADGYDPMLGIMHGRESERGEYPAFALDHIEPIRPVVDRAVLELIGSATFTGADFSIQYDGVCRLNPELARRVAQLAMDHTNSIDAELPGPGIE